MAAMSPIQTDRTAKTSCGRAYHAQFCPVFREELVHPLSRDCGCFTAAELAEADEQKRLETEGAL